MTSLELLRAAARILDEKKAVDIRAVDIGGVSVLADYFLIASGLNITHVQALSEELSDKLSLQNVLPLRIEGGRQSNWIVLDYGEVVVHIFYSETRAFFNLERLWADGKFLESGELLQGGTPLDSEPKDGALSPKSTQPEHTEEG